MALACPFCWTPFSRGRKKDQYRSPRRIVSPIPEIRLESSTSSILEPNLYVTICTNNPVLPSLSDVPYIKAQLSVSFENVSSFPHDFPCSFLCEHRDVHVVESPSPLLVIVSLLSAGRAKQDRAYPRIR